MSGVIRRLGRTRFACRQPSDFSTAPTTHKESQAFALPDRIRGLLLMNDGNGSKGLTDGRFFEASVGNTALKEHAIKKPR